MPVFENSVLLSCSPEEAFDYISDNRCELEWNPRCQGMEKITDGPVGVGTRFRAKWKGSPTVNLDVVAYDRPHSWVLHSDGSLEVNLRARLEPAPEGTMLQVSFEAIPHGFMRILFPLMTPSFRRQEQGNMQLIKAALERHLESAG